LPEEEYTNIEVPIVYEQVVCGTLEQKIKRLSHLYRCLYQMKQRLQSLQLPKRTANHVAESKNDGNKNDNNNSNTNNHNNDNDLDSFAINSYFESHNYMREEENNTEQPELELDIKQQDIETETQDEEDIYNEENIVNNNINENNENNCNNSIKSKKKKKR